MTVQIRKDIDLKELYQKAKQEKCAKVRARILGIAIAVEGKKRTEAAKIAGLSINNIRVWIKRFNKDGFEGLIDKKQPGKESTWTPEIESYLKEIVEKGASFEEDKRVAYRLEDFQEKIKKKFNIKYGISSIWYKLKSLRLSWISVRQKHPKSDMNAQEEFKKKSLLKSKKYKINIQQKK